MVFNNIVWIVVCIDFFESENFNIYDVWYLVVKKIWVKVIIFIVEVDNVDFDFVI